MSNELSVFRSENKYVLSYTQAVSLQSKLDRVLLRDGHSGEQGYTVRSLYFDSINHIDFYTKLAGTELRKKIRLRVYSPNDTTCKLEVKQKNGDLQHKISLVITKDDAQELIKGNFGVLTQYFSQSENAVYIYETMTLGCYRPVVLVEYDRAAYTYPRYDTRLTFDMRIRSSESNFDLFAPAPMYTPALRERVVLEVKYNEKLMGFISEILKPYHLSRTAVSKYCMGRKLFYEFID